MKFANFSLLTGDVQGNRTGTAVDVSVYDKFTASFYATGALVTGTVSIQATIDGTWHTLTTGYFNAASGRYYNFDGPWLSLRAAVWPTTTGYFFANARGSYY